MPTGSEVELYRNIGRIAHALERIATVLENEQSPAPSTREQQMLDEWEQLRPLVESADSLSDEAVEAVGRAIMLVREADARGITRIQQWADEQQLPTSYKPPDPPARHEGGPPAHLVEAWRRFVMSSPPRASEPDDHGALPEPPEHLAEAWRRFQAGEGLPDHVARALDEWRVDCARDAGF